MEVYSALNPFEPEQGLFLKKLQNLQSAWSISFDFMLHSVPEAFSNVLDIIPPRDLRAGKENLENRWFLFDLSVDGQSMDLNFRYWILQPKI